MIRKLLTLKNIGLFHHGCPNGAIEFSRITGIYAENGRGKSTFASVLRSCSLSDATRLKARQTLDVNEEPEVEFLLDNGARPKYAGGVWQNTQPQVVVFDSEFVEQNVYSGFSVRPEQRQSLLHFALGDTTVQLVKELEGISDAAQEQAATVKQAEKLLAGLAAPLSVQEFLDLDPVADATDQISQLQKRLEAARNAQQLLAREDPETLAPIDCDPNPVFEVLLRDIEALEIRAEEVITRHLQEHSAGGLEKWLDDGQAFLDSVDCPFCGQSLAGVQLISAYRSYFSESYKALKVEVSITAKGVTSVLSERAVDQALAVEAANRARIEAWADQIDIQVPQLDGIALRTMVTQARDMISSLVDRKLASPLEQFGTKSEADFVSCCIDSANRILSGYSEDISKIRSTISKLKGEIVTEDIDSLESNVVHLQATMRRYGAQGKEACNDYHLALKQKERLDADRQAARAKLDRLMSETLSRYESSINGTLASFGAGFSISRFSADYRGRTGEPRTDYRLVVRRQEIKLGSSSDFSSGHNFATTLSEADKRTLALAFFVARIEAEPSLSSKIVILDDPVSSMDRNRRHQTIRRIATLATSCKQLIVLSHDAYFLRDLEEQLRKQVGTPPRILGISRTYSGYSAFGSCDLEEVCASDYYRHHRMVDDYVRGEHTTNIRDVAKAIRPLLEGYLHRRFPRHIGRNKMFGKIISEDIAPATSGPLSYLNPYVEKLRSISEYANQFHHDTNPDYETAAVVDAELLYFAEQALDMIYRNG